MYFTVTWVKHRQTNGSVSETYKNIAITKIIELAKRVEKEYFSAYAFDGISKKANF